jgi:hypothetical protein
MESSSGQRQVLPAAHYNNSSPVLSLTVEEFKDLVARATRDDSQVDAEMGSRWDGGELILKPGRDGLQEKAIPIESFFHKIVMLRDRLRVLEQKINSNPKLSDGDKVELQQYVTRIYGSLTSFNILFQYRDDHFRGQSAR